MLPWKFFENLGSIIAILELFVQFLRKFCLIFLPRILNSSPTFRFMLVRRENYCYQEVQNNGKIIFFKK